MSRMLGLAFLVVLNFIPIYGVLFLKWDALLLIFSYFWETIIAILFHALRLWYVHWRWGDLPTTKANAAILAKSNGSTTIPPRLLPIFMLSVFGLFCFVQLFVLGGFAEKILPDGVFTSMYQAAKGKLAWALLSFVMLQFVQLFTEIARSKYEGVPAEELFFQPFRRIFVQQLVVILGGLFVLFGGLRSYLILLALLNLAADLFFYFIESAKLRAFVTRQNPEAENQYNELKKMMKH